ncbi:MAG TPA: SRPBCC domain-containing protein [Flavobacteriales bacterium]|nr:SRPBCC domain-containing protein [Flavobacteriales bacterium]HRE97649.1 SRPBCC domain-containing protein [Flavobacteriales bacterium]HRJ34378.1 SRPBCC domain-containing protein [Flavobacteriales bacterium]
MKKAILFDFTADKTNNTIHVKRSFHAPIDLVWAAWTESDILDQWWAPKPYRSVTKSMKFEEGGRWHYYMQGPEGDIHWCLFDYEKILPQQFYSGIDAFCDEHAVMSASKPRVKWENGFSANDDSTVVECLLKFETLEDLEAIITMGFKEGFTAGLANLDDYIAAQFYLRKDKKTDNAVRVSSYLNFDGKTEEAFHFYKSIFKTEFVKGIQRLGDFPPQEGQPPLAEEVKKMVLHVQLPITGGHILMGTDAPKEMGFTVTPGNNMHIHIEPESREEADRLFHALSEGGTVEIPIQDMFFGAYFGNFMDKYGINWMINYQPK